MSDGRLNALVVKERAGKKYWTKIGSAFPTREGGYQIELDALPLEGVIVLMPPKEDRKSDNGSRERDSRNDRGKGDNRRR